MPKPSLLVASLLLTACTVSADDDDLPPQTCDDPLYGDGVCQAQLSCAVPDIDCFITFSDDAAALSWFTEKEAKLAAQANRAPRALLPLSDPRYLQARALVDRGWDAFRTARSVGMLGDLKPGVVVIEDKEPNAFVLSDTLLGKAGFSVQVQTGLLALAATDDAKLSVMMHELQHAVGLHGIADTKERLRTYYVAPEGSEPVGRTQVDDAAARSAISGWRNASEDVGPYAASELGPLPLGGDQWEVLDFVAALGVQALPAQCTQPAQVVRQLRATILATADPLDGKLLIDLQTQVAKINAALVGLRDDCLATLTKSYVEIVAVMRKTTPQAVMAAMTASDLQLVTGKHVVNAIAALTIDRRTKMRTFETMLPQGRPWAAARYFSTEEDADDVSVFVMRATGGNAAALADIMVQFVSLKDGQAGERCAAAVAANTVPAYGVNLNDEHHHSCWRAYHITQLAGSAMQSAHVHVAPEIPPSLPAVQPELVIMD